MTNEQIADHLQDIIGLLWSVESLFLKSEHWYRYDGYGKLRFPESKELFDAVHQAREKAVLLAQQFEPGLEEK